MAKRKWYIHVDTLEIRQGKDFQKLPHGERGLYCELPRNTFAVQQPYANGNSLLTAYGASIPKDATSALVRTTIFPCDANLPVHKSVSIFDSVAHFIKCVGNGVMHGRQIYFFIPIDWSK